MKKRGRSHTHARTSCHEASSLATRRKSGSDTDLLTARPESSTPWGPWGSGTGRDIGELLREWGLPWLWASRCFSYLPGWAGNSQRRHPLTFSLGMARCDILTAICDAQGAGPQGGLQLPLVKLVGEVFLPRHLQGKGRWEGGDGDNAGSKSEDAKDRDEPCVITHYIRGVSKSRQTSCVITHHI